MVETQDPLTAPLPPLREKLTLHGAPRLTDGTPAWTLHDTVANRFFRVGWREFAILCRWHLGNPTAIAHSLQQETTLNDTQPEQVHAFVQFLEQNGLLQAVSEGARKALFVRSKTRPQGLGLFLLKNYLFFRIPLAHPDHLLKRLLPYLGWLWSTSFIQLTILAGLLGLYLVSRQWDRFITTFADYSTLEGVVLFMLATSLVKTAHELGHALTARRFGCRVPSMGVAFLVMWPVLYTDVGEAWKLPSRRQRLLVGAAGLLSEIIIAAWMTLLWNFLPDGNVRGAVFFMAAASWLLSILINASPFLRFDGYFLLCDLLEVPNLHKRAGDMGRWRMRRLLWGLLDPDPEPGLWQQRPFLIAFAFATWLYRLLLFLGIALAVYHLFFKLLGIFLMGVEVVWFIALPIGRELLVWWRRRTEIAVSGHALPAMLILLILFSGLFFPWRGSITLPGLLLRAPQTVLYVPAAAQVKQRSVTMGQRVKKGEILLQLDSPDLLREQGRLTREIALLEWRLAFFGLDPDLAAGNPVLRQELASRMVSREGVERQIAELRIEAPEEGEVVGLLEHMSEGDWLPANEPLVTLVSPTGRQIESYAAEADLQGIAPSAQGHFFPDNLDWPVIPARVATMDPLAVSHLPSAELSSTTGGPIPVREDKDKRLVPETARFRILLQVEEERLPNHIMRGSVVLPGKAESLAARLYRAVVAVAIRESGF